MKIRTRFAPSPTGHLHVGNIRTALYSWLFARKLGGKFLLRIEDSDVQRVSDNAIKIIISGLKWLSLDWDEGPYFQSSRMERYNSIIDSMLRSNIAYKCYCSPERLRSLRLTQMKNGEKPKYDGHCRINSIMNVNAKKLLKRPYSYVVRFRNPLEGTVVFRDQIRGVITFNNKELDDLIIRRADGYPTYNFCVVVDDMDMNITHVIRGEEHINNTPRQINILKALNASIPTYIHVSMVLDKDRKKLSKRYNALGIMDYRNLGFLPESILNYLVRLGWSYGNQEIFSIDQMIKCFDIKKMKKSASIFSFEKLLWLNHYYINNLPVSYIASHLRWHMDKENIDLQYGPKLVDVIKLFSESSHTLKEMVNNCYYFYKDFNFFEKKLAEDHLNPAAIIILNTLREKLNVIVDWTPECIRMAIIEVVNKLGTTMHIVGTLVRVSVINTDQSPGISKIIYVIGKSRVLNRLDKAICYIHSMFM